MSGSITINAGGVYETPTLTELNAPVSDNYILNSGTFTHKNGKVKFTGSSWGAIKSGGSSVGKYTFYDVEVDMGGGEGVHVSTVNYETDKTSDPINGGLVIKNDLTINASKTFSMGNIGFPIRVQGKAIINGLWKNYSSDWGTNAAGNLYLNDVELNSGGELQPPKTTRETFISGAYRNLGGTLTNV